MAKAMRTSPIVGPDGEALTVAHTDLAERTVRPSVVGFRRAQSWRSVITGLTPERLRAILRSVAQGTWTPDFFELAEEMEERDLHYRGVIQQRKLKAAGAPIDVAPASDDPADVEIAEHVRAEVLHGRGAHDARVELLDAVAKGVSCQEVVWDLREGRWRPAAYERVDQRWLVFDDADGTTPYIIGTDAGTARGHAPMTGPGGQWGRLAAPLEPAKFVYHRHKSKSGLPSRGGLAYAVCTMYLLKSVAARDWWAFSDVFGLPVRVGKYGPNASDDDIRTLIDAVAMVASDAGCVIPDSMQLELVQAGRSSGSGSDAFFERMADWCDAQTSKGVVGQTMTVEDGSSLSQAQIHADIRADIIDDDVRQMCDTLTELAAWYCALNFAPRPAGWPRIAPPPDEEAVDVGQVVAAVKGGLRVGQTWLRERMGIPEPADDDEVLSGVPPGGAAPAAGDEDPVPPPEMNRLALHAADPLDDSPWLGLADDLARPVLDALEAAGDPVEFLELASRAEIPAELARDLALRCYAERIEGETGREP